MAARHEKHKEHEKRAKGGVAKREKEDKGIQVYDAKGSKEDFEADDETPEFKKGGRAEHKHGGHVKGEKEHKRADRMERGHHAHGGRVKRKAGGHSPYSSAHSTEGEASDKAGRGHESVGLGED